MKVVFLLDFKIGCIHPRLNKGVYLNLVIFAENNFASRQKNG